MDKKDNGQDKANQTDNSKGEGKGDQGADETPGTTANEQTPSGANRVGSRGGNEDEKRDGQHKHPQMGDEKMAKQETTKQEESERERKYLDRLTQKRETEDRQRLREQQARPPVTEPKNKTTDQTTGVVQKFEDLLKNNASLEQ